MTVKLPGGGLGILAILALVGGGLFMLSKAKGSNGGGGMGMGSVPPTASMYGARKVGGCGCGK